MKLKKNILAFLLILILIFLSLIYITTGKIKKNKTEDDQPKETITNVVENKNKELNLTYLVWQGFFAYGRSVSVGLLLCLLVNYLLKGFFYG